MRPTSERFFIGFGALSLFFASGVVLTGMVFPSLLLNPRRLFSHIIFCISMCDMFTGIACAFGYPPPESLLCPIQGFMTIFFPVGSWTWTTMLVFQLRSILTNRHAQFSISQMHLICWSIAALVTFLPLTQVAYGTDEESTNLSPCEFRNPDSNLVSRWIAYDYFGTFLLAIVVMVLCLVDVWRKNAGRLTLQSQNAIVIFNTMRLYPIALILLWMPLCVYFYSATTDSSSASVVFEEAAQVISTQYGTVTSLIFFITTNEPIQRWSKYLCGQGIRECDERGSPSSVEDVPCFQTCEEEMMPPSQGIAEGDVVLPTISSNLLHINSVF